MAEGVIESLEVVEVQEKNGDGLLLATSQLQLSFERFFQEAPVKQASQRITNRLFTKRFPQLQAGQRKGDLRGRTDGQSLMRVPKTHRSGIVSELRRALEFEMQNANRVPLRDHWHA